MDWNTIELNTFEMTEPYGFVVNHRAFWGIPIDGTNDLPLPENASLTDLQTPPTKLLINSVNLDLGPELRWTGGSFDILATCTPPLFHALHHKTDEEFRSQGHMKAEFEPRSSVNVIEREFSPRNPLPNKASEACVKLFSAEFDGEGCPLEITNPGELDFTLFDMEQKVTQEAGNGYFETRRNTWDIDSVRSLNALWFVILKKESNLPISRLGGGYRLWHHLDHEGRKAGYDWKIEQNTANIHKYRVTVKLSGSEMEAGLKECPNETITICFEYEWLYS